ncbi:MAG: hypothetical protein ACK4WH_13270 [Phycisphaerales bacterium]
MSLIPAPVRSAVRFHLDGLRLHPHRRLVVAGLLAGLIGVVWLGGYTVAMLRAAPAPPEPPKPLALLPGLADSAAQLAELKSITGIQFPEGWTLVAATANARADGPSTRSWLFMKAKSDGRPVPLEPVLRLSPKPPAPAAAAELADALALSLNRLTVGKPASALSTPAWDAPASASVRLDVLELEQVVIARVVCFPRK